MAEVRSCRPNCAGGSRTLPPPRLAATATNPLTPRRLRVLTACPLVPCRRVLMALMAKSVPTACHAQRALSSSSCCRPSSKAQ